MPLFHQLKLDLEKSKLQKKYLFPSKVSIYSFRKMIYFHQRPNMYLHFKLIVRKPILYSELHAKILSHEGIM